jgi:hypothetical protein
MKNKIIGILVCMLLIGTGTIVVADWNPDDGHKMHYPQEPDPNGWDIDWGYWLLGDDWKCTECGTVNEIHFWISWYLDEVLDIPWIFVSIWSNNPGGEYSYPEKELWNRTFYTEDFIIAGPWDGEQGWYVPPFGEWEEYNHYRYYQVNIMEIEKPFLQKEGEIYWLVINMPYKEFTIGWKTSISDQFMDTSVYGIAGGGWIPIYDPLDNKKLDLAFVINGEPSKPDLTCNGSLSWREVKPGSTVTGTFTVCNEGETCSKLNWEIDPTTPGFGTWTFTPASGTLAAGDCINVNAECTAPSDQDTEFTGKIKVFNSDFPSDNCEIDVYLHTPRIRNTHVHLLERLFERFPTVFTIFKYILGLQ